MGHSHASAGRGHDARPGAAGELAAAHRPAPGKQTLVEQRCGRADGAAAAGAHGEHDAERRRRATAAHASDGGGAPLEGDIRSWMERVFACDFSAVRVYEGPEAAAVGALAYTQGEDIYFAPGAYRPDTAEGREILAHELTHVVQQRAGGLAMQAKGAAVNGDGGLEAEADRLGARAAAGERVEVRGVASASSGVQRVTGYPTKEGAQLQPPEIRTGHKTSGIADRILQNLRLAGEDALKHDKDEDGKRDHDTTPTKGYMIGVVEVDTGEIYAACSGAKPPAFDKAVIAAGAIPLDCFVPKETARDIVRDNLPKGSTQDGSSGGVVSEKEGWTEHGAPAGACAASKLVWAMLKLHIGKPIELTEKLFAPVDGPTVVIADNDDHPHYYQDGEIVPSCATCQVFLRALLPHVSKEIDSWREEERVRLEKEAQEKAAREKLAAEARESERLMNEHEAARKQLRAQEEKEKKQEKQEQKEAEAQSQQLVALEKIAPKVKQLFLKDLKKKDSTGVAADTMKEDVVEWFKDLGLEQKVALSQLSNAQAVHDRMIEAYNKLYG